MKTKIELTCPKCGAHLSVEPSREILFCEYCGTKVLLNDENTHTIRHVDEAELVYAETERLIRLKEIELAENKAREAKEKSKKLVKLSGLLAIIGVFLIIVGIIAHSFSVEVGIIFLLELAGAWLLLMALCLVLSTLQQ